MSIELYISQGFHDKDIFKYGSADGLVLEYTD